MVQIYLISRITGWDKISVECDVDLEAEQCYMPSFLLQPLIENSIIHGLENRWIRENSQ